MRPQVRYLAIATTVALLIFFLHYIVGSRGKVVSQRVEPVVPTTKGPGSSQPEYSSGSGSTEAENTQSNPPPAEKELEKDTTTAYALILPKVVDNVQAIESKLGKLWKYKHSLIISDTKTPFSNNNELSVVTFRDIENRITELIRAGERFKHNTPEVHKFLAFLHLKKLCKDCKTFHVEIFGQPGYDEVNSINDLDSMIPIFASAMNYFKIPQILLPITKKTTDPLIEYDKTIYTPEKYIVDKLLNTNEPIEISTCQSEFVEPDCSNLRTTIDNAEKTQFPGLGGVSQHAKGLHSMWPYQTSDFKNLTDWREWSAKNYNKFQRIMEASGKTFSEEIEFDKTRVEVNKVNLVINLGKFTPEKDHLPIVITWSGNNDLFFKAMKSLSKVKDIEKTLLIVMISSTEQTQVVINGIEGAANFCLTRVFFQPYTYDRRVWFHGVRENCAFIHTHLLVLWELGYKSVISLNDKFSPSIDLYVRMRSLLQAKERGAFEPNVISFGATPYVMDYQCDLLAWERCKTDKGICGPKDKNLFLKARTFSLDASVITREIVVYYRNVFSGGLHISPWQAIQSLFVKHEYYQVQPCVPMITKIPEGEIQATAIAPREQFVEKIPEIFIINEKDVADRVVKLDEK